MGVILLQTYRVRKPENLPVSIFPALESQTFIATFSYMDTGEQTKPFMVFIASTTADELFPQPSTFFYIVYIHIHTQDLLPWQLSLTD